MTKDEINELSGVEAADDCCPFCASKCPDCGSVNIVGKYRRYYQIGDMQLTFEQSDAKLYCYDCNPEIDDENFFYLGEEYEGQWEAHLQLWLCR